MDRVHQIRPQLFVNNDGQFCASRAAKVLSENQDFIVIGILGEQGTGKSTVLNQLLGLQPVEAGSFRTGSGADAMQNATTGIAIQVSRELRIVALDTAPLNSGSTLLALARSQADRPPGIPSELSGNATCLQLRQDLQRTVMLLAVCHLVVVLESGHAGTLAWDMIQAAEMLALSLPPVFGEEGDTAAGKPRPQAHLADVLFVRRSSHGAREEEEEELQRVLASYFHSSRLCRHHRLGARSGSKGISLMVLPTASDPLHAGQGEYEAVTQQLLGYRAAPFPVTELAWLRGCQSTWDLVLQSPALREYVDLACGE